jgi:hypothetical protein
LEAYFLADFSVCNSLSFVQSWSCQKKNIGEMCEALQEFFGSKDADFYCRGIFNLIEKWQEVIEVEREYYD